MKNFYCFILLAISCTIVKSQSNDFQQQQLHQDLQNLNNSIHQANVEAENQRNEIQYQKALQDYKESLTYDADAQEQYNKQVKEERMQNTFNFCKKLFDQFPALVAQMPAGKTTTSDSFGFFMGMFEDYRKQYYDAKIKKYPNN
jgi:hypothetical protein